MKPNRTCSCYAIYTQSMSPVLCASLGYQPGKKFMPQLIDLKPPNW